MIEYIDNGKIALIDNFRFIRDSKTNYYLSTRKINGKRKRLHIYMWEKYNGEVPKGFHIHHKDENKSNNEINNLEMLSASEHEKLHGSAWSEERKEQARKNLIENAIPKASEWHKSKEGREWHKQHGKDAWEKRESFIKICENCGKEYKTRHLGNSKYCSNACKASARRKSGVDNETRKCEWCGREFTVNKYSKSTTCSASCKRHKYWDKKHKEDRF